MNFLAEWDVQAVGPPRVLFRRPTAYGSSPASQEEAMSAPSRHRPVLVLTLALAALVTLTWPSVSTAQPAAPSLRLIGPLHDLTLRRVKGRVTLNVRTWVASTGGDFEVRVARPDYDSPAGVVQVDSLTGAGLRDLPDDVLDSWFGLAHFTQVVIRDTTGEEVAGG